MEVIRFRMEQRGEGQPGLARPLGSTPRAPDVHNRKRSLTLEMVWRLNRDWHFRLSNWWPYELGAEPPRA